MLDGGLYRTPRPAEKRTASRLGTAHQSHDDVEPVEEQGSAHYPRLPQAITKTSKPSQWFMAALAVAIIAIITGFWWFTQPNTPNAGVAIDSSKYQAVFFTNGQVYFGKLHTFNNDYLKLTDVFYLQTKEAAANGTENLQQTAKNSSNDVQLVKLGNEIHGPQDEMVVNKSQLLFFENLKGDSKVAGSIDQYKKANNK